MVSARANSIDISADGKSMAQGGYLGVVIWDLTSLEKRHVLRAESVTDVRFSSDGRTLATAGTGGKSKLRDTTTGMRLVSSSLGNAPLYECRFSPDANSLAILSRDGKIRRLDAADAQHVDRDPLTHSTLYRRGLNQVQDEEFVRAEATFTYLLDLQQQTLTPDNEDLNNTRTELIGVLKRLDKYPRFTRHPESQRVTRGQAVTLRVDVENKENYSYQWFFDRKPIADATEPTLALPAISVEQLGRYHAEVRFGATEHELVVASHGAFLFFEANPTATGWLRSDLFFEIQGEAVSDLTASPNFPERPDGVSSIGAFELPSNVDDHYGTRISGFIIPPESGDYVFYLCSDDSSQLFLSTDESPANKRAIARLDGWHGVPRGWQSLKPENISSPIPLEAGKRYWVEARFIESEGADHFSVTWQLPDTPPPKNGDQPIPGEYLEFQLE